MAELAKLNYISLKEKKIKDFLFFLVHARSLSDFADYYHICQGPSWSWSYGSWIYNYLCNQCLPPLKL